MPLPDKEQEYKEIIAGLKAGKDQYAVFERKLFEAFYYLIEKAIKDHHLDKEEAFDAYSDTILQVIQAIRNNSFEEGVSLSAVVPRIFSHKCIDLIRKKTTKKQGVHESASIPEMLNQLPGEVINEEITNKVRSYLHPPDSVLMGASAPSGCNPGDQFTARFVAYVESIEKQIQEKLEKMSTGSTIHLGVKRCRWQKGTVVKVNVYGNHLVVDPPYEEFAWEGLYNILDFDVTVLKEAPGTKTIIKFDVLIDEITVARLRFDLEINLDPENRIRKVVAGKPIESAFASYASEDRARVLDRLSEIRRIGIDVYLDCLSMRPGEKWKQVLKKEIESRDSFLLFWSSYAKKSEMVTWEWQTALKYKGIDKIEPHPLAPVSEAEPPEELRELHFGDVYMTIRKDHDQSTLHANDQADFLDERCHKILLLYIDGYTDKEIAEQMGMSAATIKTTRMRCLNKLRQLLSRDMDRK
jgi:RNA polymerase sigma factor (sigma-70 family)